MRPDDQSFLAALLDAHGGAAGTVHRLEDGLLRISAAVRIPPPVMEATRLIPEGKGMAGLAWARRAPVQTCNLQDDASGDVRPGAKAVGAGAAVALPVFDAEGALRAVVGIAFPEAGELSHARVRTLSEAAGSLPDS